MQLTNDEKILQKIVKRVWEDPVFKRDLISSPVETIEQFIGRSINLPEGKTLSVVDQTNSSVIYINLPAKLDMEDVELDEAQLDAVSGGEGVPGGIIKPSIFGLG